MWGVNSTDDEKEDGDNERTGCGGTVPPPYAGNSPSFGLLERAAEEGGNDNAAFHLQKARMAFIDARASMPVRQADIRPFFLDLRRGGGAAQQSCAAWFRCGIPDLVTVMLPCSDLVHSQHQGEGSRLC